MNYAHLHLLLNHFPIMCSIIGLALFLGSFFNKNQDLRKSSLIIFVGGALLVIPTFLSGFGASLRVSEDPSMPNALILRHEGAAMLAIWFMLITGALASIGLWQSHRMLHPARWNVSAVLLFSVLSVGLMARTGNTGGDISHPEVRSSQDATVEGTVGAFIHAFEPNPGEFSDLMISSKWWWWVMMALHFIGLALIIGTVGILDIRIMGFLKQLPVAPLHQFIPWALAGLAVNIVTGILAFIAQPNNYIFSLGLWLKMLSLLLLGLNAAAFYLTGVFGRVEKLGAEEDAPISAKLVAASGLLLWFAVVAFGRYIQPWSSRIRPF